MSNQTIYVEMAGDPLEVDIGGTTITIDLLGLVAPGSIGIDLPKDLGTPAAGSSAYSSAQDHVHQMPDAADVGADAAGVASAFMSAHLAAVDPHPQYASASGFATHIGLTTAAHGGIVASTDPRLTDARTPLAHAASHAIGAVDAVFPSGSALQYLRRNAANLAIEWTADAVAPAAHQLDGALHTVSGLTAGHFLKALSTTTFGFAAHGLTASDVGADATGTAASAVSTHVGLSDPHTQYQKEIEKGAIGGYCPLDGAALIPSTYLPAIAITDFLGIVATQAAMLLLTGEKGDWCVRSDAPTRTFIIIANDGHLITDWQVLYTPAAPVLSVNTYVGAVSLTYSDVGACATGDARLSDARTPTAHQLDSATYHTVSGLTAGHILTALTPTTFGFAAPAVADLSAAVIILPTTSARNVIQPSGAAIIPLIVKAFAAQTVNLLEFQDSAGVAITKINAYEELTSSRGSGTHVCLHGDGAGRALTTGGDNSFFGYHAGYACADGVQNACFGSSAGAALSSGNRNTAFGYAALAANTTYNSNAAFGNNAAALFVGEGITAIGGYAGWRATSGYGQTFVGNTCGYEITTGSANTFIGSNAGRGCTTLQNSTFLGMYAGIATLPIASVTGDGATVTLTTSEADPSGMYAGAVIGMYNWGGGTGIWNGTFTLTRVNSTTYTYPSTGNGTATGGGGVWQGAHGALCLGMNAKTKIPYGCALGATGAASLLVGINSDLPGAHLHINTKADATKGIIVRRFSATQSANLLEIQTSDGLTNLTKIGPTGIITSIVDAVIHGLVIGMGAGAVATNTALGATALNVNSTGYANVAVGADALYLNTTGAGNTAVGRSALISNVSGNNCTAVGMFAAYLNTANYITAIGNEALRYSVSATNATAVGYQALMNNSGNNNTATGYKALTANTTGYSNCASGSTALAANTEGTYSAAFGFAAAASATTGGFNTALGALTLNACTTGASNTAVGVSALQALVTGSGNTAIGGNALNGNNGQNNNTAVGRDAGRYIADGATLNVLGSWSVFLGAYTKALGDNQVNQIVIGYGAIGAGANTATLGNTSILTTVLRGNIRIGATEGTSATQTVALATGTAPSTSPADAFQMYSADQAAGNACAHFRTENGGIVKLFTGAALTAQSTTITASAPGTPDYAIQDLVAIGGYGFVTADEGQTALSVIANLQTRVAELEARLQANGLLT